MADNWGDFCSFCGVALSGDFPRKCDNGHFTYASPVTVGAALQPVHVNGRTGILVVQRNINPRKGEYALPAGFVDQGELSRPASVRELFEETSLRVDVAQAVYFNEATGWSHNPADPRVHNMYFYALPVLDEKDITLNFSNEETQSLNIVFLSKDGESLEDLDDAEMKLCFTTHHNTTLAFLKQL